MALSTQSLIKGLVSRLLPSPNPDSQNTDVAFRQWRYGELAIVSMTRKHHNLCDEGSYFITNNAQTGVAMVTTSGFTATSPFIIVSNNNTVGGNNIYLDYITLVCTVAGTAASGLTYTGAQFVLDTGLRYSSAGSNITANIVGANMNLANTKSGASVYTGALVATAPSGVARTLVGLRVVRPALSGTVATVVGDVINFNFGGVESAANGNVSITAGVMNTVPVPMPPAVIGPQQSALLYINYAASGTPVAAQWASEVAYWER